MNHSFHSYEEENIHYWSNRASGYSNVNKEELTSNQKSVWSTLLDERIQKHFQNRDRADIHILDIGTGPGFFAIILRELGYHVTGIDYTKSMLLEAKKNAKHLSNDIHFLQMNAEELTFPSKSFDVIFSRNLTWNLPHPQKAYTHWVRVLKDGGLLLNFDANWYHYLHDEEAKSAHLTDRANIAASDVEDECAGTNVDAMEAIARQTPLSALSRPKWDKEILSSLHMQVKTYLATSVDKAGENQQCFHSNVYGGIKKRSHWLIQYPFFANLFFLIQCFHRCIDQTAIGKSSLIIGRKSARHLNIISRCRIIF